MYSNGTYERMQCVSDHTTLNLRISFCLYGYEKFKWIGGAFIFHGLRWRPQLQRSIKLFEALNAYGHR